MMKLWNVSTNKQLWNLSCMSNERSGSNWRVFSLFFFWTSWSHTGKRPPAHCQPPSVKVAAKLLETRKRLYTIASSWFFFYFKWKLCLCLSVVKKVVVSTAELVIGDKRNLESCWKFIVGGWNLSVERVHWLVFQCGAVYSKVPLQRPWKENTRKSPLVSKVQWETVANE